MLIEIHGALHVCKWNSSQSLTLPENSCCVCQGAIPSPQLDLHFLPVFTVP